MNFPHKEDKHVQNPKYPIPNWYAGGWNGTEMQLLSAAISLPRDYGASGAAGLSVKGLLAHGAVRITVISYSINARNSPLGRGVVRSCTPVPLPDNHVLDRFAVNGANTVFTILVAGTYLVSYLVNTTAALLMPIHLCSDGRNISFSACLAPDCRASRVPI